MRPIFILFFILLLNACAKKEVIQVVSSGYAQVNSIKNNEPTPLPIDSIHNQPWHWFYGKYATEFDDGSKKITFKTSLKCSKDSAINVLVSFAAIPIINGLVTKDSLIYVRKKDRCYDKKSIESLNTYFGVELSMKNLEELFLGLPIGYGDQLNYTQLPTTSPDSTYFVANTTTGKSIEYRYGLTNKTQQIAWQQLTSAADETVVIVKYSDWYTADKMKIPGNIAIEIKSKEQNFRIRFTYDKIELNIPLEIYLLIPSDYAPCK